MALGRLVDVGVDVSVDVDDGFVAEDVGGVVAVESASVSVSVWRIIVVGRPALGSMVMFSTTVSPRLRE